MPWTVGFEQFPQKVGALSAVLQVPFTRASAPQLKSGLPSDQCWLKT